MKVASCSGIVMYSLDGFDVFLSAWGPGLWLGGSNGILETNFPLMVEMNGIETWSFSCWQLLLWFSTQEQNDTIFFFTAVKKYLRNLTLLLWLRNKELLYVKVYEVSWSVSNSFLQNTEPRFYGWNTIEMAYNTK